LEDLKEYLTKYPYSEEFTESNIRSFEKAISFFEEDPLLENGRKICIDLSKCDSYQKKLLGTVILQAIKNYVEMNESPNPIGIVVIGDADDVLKKPPHDEYRRNYEKNREYCKKIEEENYFLTKEQIEEAIGENNLMNVQLEQVYYMNIVTGILHFLLSAKILQKFMILYIVTLKLS
jgi:hypothetical protein